MDAQLRRGRRLAGIGQRIAFCAMRGDGFPQEADGELLAADGTRLAALHSLHDGMGAIDLTAEANREGLTARLWPRGDTARSVVLPLPAAEVGYALRTEPSHGDGSVTCRILRSGAASEGLQLSLYVYLRPEVTFRDAVRDWRTVAHYPFGYAQPAYFFDPTYPDGPDDTARPDLRKALRWLPSLQTDGRGEIPFQYYNSDHPGPRYVVVEGVTFDGRPVHYETVIE